MGLERGFAPQPAYSRVPYAQVHYSRRKQLLEAHPALRDLQKPYLPSGACAAARRTASAPLTGATHRRRPAAFVVAIVIAQVAIAAYIARQHWGPLGVLLAAYLCGAVLDHAMWVLIHDLTHDAVFANKHANHAFLLVANIPLVFPSSMSFRHYHRLHHAYLNECYNDPDMPSPWEAKVRRTSCDGRRP